MTFKFILESQLSEGKYTFVTVEDCKDLEDAVNHIHAHFKHQSIEKVTKVK